MTNTAIVPNSRNSVVCSAFTHAVPRMPPRNTYAITTDETMAPPSSYGMKPLVIARSTVPPPITAMMM